LDTFYLVSKPLWHYFAGCFGGGPAVVKNEYITDRTPLIPAPQISVKNYNQGRGESQEEKEDDLTSQNSSMKASVYKQSSHQPAA